MTQRSRPMKHVTPGRDIVADHRAIQAEQREVLDEVAAEMDSEVRSYSGRRGMGGMECVGITTTDPFGCIEAAAKRGIMGARMDSMGKQHIVYWPLIPAEVRNV